MLDPRHIGLNAESIGFQVSHRQPVDWRSFSTALQNQSDSVKTRRELKETPISELHIMGGQLFGYEGNSLLDTNKRQQRQMNGYRLRSFDARDGAIVLPPKDAGSLNMMIPSKAGLVQYNRWNSVIPQTMVMRSVEPLNIPISQEQRVESMINMNNSREQILQNMKLHNKKRSLAEQNAAAEAEYAVADAKRFGGVARQMRNRETYYERLQQEEIAARMAMRNGEHGTGIVATHRIAVPSEISRASSQTNIDLASEMSSDVSQGDYGGGYTLSNSIGDGSSVSSKRSRASSKSKSSVASSFGAIGSNHGGGGTTAVGVSQLTLPSISASSPYVQNSHVSGLTDDTLNDFVFVNARGQGPYVPGRERTDAHRVIREDGDMYVMYNGHKERIGNSGGRLYFVNLETNERYAEELRQLEEKDMRRDAQMSALSSSVNYGDSKGVSFSGSMVENNEETKAILNVSAAINQSKNIHANPLQMYASTPGTGPNIPLQTPFTLQTDTAPVTSILFGEDGAQTSSGQVIRSGVGSVTPAGVADLFASIRQGKKLKGVSTPAAVVSTPEKAEGGGGRTKLDFATEVKQKREALKFGMGDLVLGKSTLKKTPAQQKAVIKEPTGFNSSLSDLVKRRRKHIEEDNQTEDNNDDWL